MTEEVKKVVEEMNKLATELKSIKDTENLKNADTEKKFDRMADQLTKLAEAQQKREASEKAQAEQIEQLSAALARAGGGSDKSKLDEKIEASKKALDLYLRTGELPAGMKKSPDGGVEVRAMSTESDVNGGVLVLPEMANFLSKRVFETSPMEQIATVITGSAKSLTVIVDDDEQDANHTGEDSASSNDGTPELGQVEIFAHKTDAEPQATIEMLQDGFFDVESWLQGKAADKIARKNNTAHITGSGVGRARGIMSYSAWASAGTYERGKVEQINMGATATLTGDGLISVQNGLKEAYQTGASWLMKRGTFGAVMKLKGADNYFFSPTLLKDGTNLQLLGKPVRFADDVAAVAANALALAYGDFKEAYTIYKRAGLLIVRDPFTNKGRVKLYTALRSGGAVTNFDALKIGKVAV